MIRIVDILKKAEENDEKGRRHKKEVPKLNISNSTNERTKPAEKATTEKATKPVPQPEKKPIPAPEKKAINENITIKNELEKVIPLLEKEYAASAPVKAGKPAATVPQKEIKPVEKPTIVAPKPVEKPIIAAPVKEAPKQVEQPADPKKLIELIIALMKEFLKAPVMTDELAKKCMDFINPLEKLMELQLQNKYTETQNIIKNQNKENEIFSHSLKIALVAAKMGIDVRYNKKQLSELAAKTIIVDLESANLPSEYHVKTLKDVVVTCVNLNVEAYEKIINMAKIYIT